MRITRNAVRNGCFIILIAAIFVGILYVYWFNELASPKGGAPLDPKLSALKSGTESSPYIITKDLIGFPFDTDGYEHDIQLLLNKDSGLFKIADKIYEWNQNGLLKDNKRKTKITDILASHHAKSVKKTDYCSGFEIFEKMGDSSDTVSVMAAFYISCRYKEIGAIEPYLKYANIFTGSKELATCNCMPISQTLIPTYYHITPENFKPEDRIHLFPAAYAILSNPEQSVPLLIAYAEEFRHPKNLRLKAIGFLYTIDPEYVTLDLAADLEEQTECILRCRRKWRDEYIDDPCFDEVSLAEKGYSLMVERMKKMHRDISMLKFNKETFYIDREKQQRTMWGKY